MENNEYNFKPEPYCPVVDIDGVIADGKQFDLDITLPKDKSNVIFGTVKNAYKEPVEDAVVKLVEIKYGKDGRKERLPVSHTFTTEDGEFVFGPLCPDKEYGIVIWVDDVRHYKVCAKIEKDKDCLRGKHVHDCGCMRPDYKPECKPEKPDEKPDYKPEEKPEDKPENKPCPRNYR